MLENIRKALSSKGGNFSESVELAINLQNIDLSKPQNRIDLEVVLPHGTGKKKKIAVFSKGELAVKAGEKGIDVISPDEIGKLGSDKKLARKIAKKYDFLLAETKLMPDIGRNLGPILGPRGKMPVPVPPAADVSALIAKLEKTVKMRSKDKPTFHVPIGRKDMPAEQIQENFEAVMKKLEGKLERGRQNIRSVYIKTTMGKPVKLI
jgi:large subunit ribosomal protein L1